MLSYMFTLLHFWGPPSLPPGPGVSRAPPNPVVVGIGDHTSGASSPGSSTRIPTVRADSRQREATGTCLDEVTALGPTPEGGPIKAHKPPPAPWPLQTPPLS